MKNSPYIYGDFFCSEDDSLLVFLYKLPIQHV